METALSTFKLPEETKIQLREISNEIGENMTQTLILIIEKIYKNETDRDILKNMDAKEKVVAAIMKQMGLNKDEAEQLRIMSIVYTKKRNRIDECANPVATTKPNNDDTRWNQLLKEEYAFYLRKHIRLACEDKPAFNQKWQEHIEKLERDYRQ